MGRGGNDEFVGTELLTQELLKDVTKEDETEIEEKAEMAEIRDGMKSVEFLEALPEIVRSDTDDQTAIGEMQKFKEREPELVRWRSVKAPVNDAEFLVRLEAMRNLVYAKTRPLDLNVILPGSASEMTIEVFAQQAHRRSLEVTKLKIDTNHDMRVEYQKLLQELPPSTMKKLPPHQLNTEQGRALAITQLVSKHSGEVVELDARRAGWRLLEVPASGSIFQATTSRSGACQTVTPVTRPRMTLYRPMTVATTAIRTP